MRETLVFKLGTHHGTVVSKGPCAEIHRNNRSGHADLKYYGGYLVAESVPPELVPLLTAAPKLRDVCQKFVDILGNSTAESMAQIREAFDEAQAAIAKAEGRA